MNLLVVGVSHRTAPVALLERIAVRAAETPELLRTLLKQPHIGEAVVLSTCNRVEIYAAVTGFHGALAEAGAVLAARAGVDVQELVPHLQVRYDDEAVRHAFRVASGLDSMVVGEAQILGQLRDAYAVAVEHDAVGRTLHELVQQALRVGKRAHTETDIGTAGRSVMTAALHVGLAQSGISINRASALVIGTGAMGALALATLRRAGATGLTVAGRSPERVKRLADAYAATAVPITALTAVLNGVDIVVSATASATEVLATSDLAGGHEKPLLVLDLAVPHDVDPAVAGLPGVTLVGIASLSESMSGTDVSAAEAIVDEEVTSFLRWLRGAEVGPAVAALRARADELVGAELAGLRRRRPELSDEQRADLAQTVHRIVGRLLHQPTVRVRELASGPDGDRYAAVIRELFDPTSGTNGVKRALEIL